MHPGEFFAVRRDTNKGCSRWYGAGLAELSIASEHAEATRMIPGSRRYSSTRKPVRVCGVDPFFGP